MTQFITRRLLQSVAVVMGVSVVTFLITFVTGDPAILLLPPDATAEQVQALRQRLGLDQPVHVQYWRFVSRAIVGDFGASLRQHQPAMGLVLERIPATLKLSVSALLFSVIVAIPAGVVAATRRDSVYDSLTMVGVLLGQSMPNFWMGILIILVFGVYFRWLPISGSGGLLHLIGPTLTLGFFPMARNVRLVRSSLLEVLNQDYIRTARAKGLSERIVVYRHALRNALIPVVTVIALQVGFFLGGAVITETIFAWPGVGRLMVQAIYGRDFPIIQAGVVLLASGFVLINLLVDIFYAYLDPRIRLG